MKKTKKEINAGFLCGPPGILILRRDVEIKVDQSRKDQHASATIKAHQQF